MNKDLYELVSEAKSKPHNLEPIIFLFQPKILKSLFQTKQQEREDLTQELVILIIKIINRYDVDKTPGFFEFQTKYHKKK
ncbi:hypothetical protein [Peribacillus sp. AS_2]|uniref:hypothetical protein n=1 Tax=Peribacillus sp. AS_2 TaxID=2996755 RepID=UPI0022A7ACC4|nr:hypothetical protein [Peribacillus sp. AS_2]MCZ0874147.1 hypothetical protein [Peribacillus sp. AS_2]